MPNHTQQRLERRPLGEAAEPLPRKPDERGAVTVIRLEAAGAELHPRRLRLRRREQTHPPGEAPLQLRRPRAMQRARRLNRDHGTASNATPRDQPLELVDALAQRRQRQRLSNQAAVAAGQPDAIRDLARIDRHHQRLRRKRLPKQNRHEQPPFEKEKKQDNAAPRTGTPSEQLSAYQRSDAYVTCRAPHATSRRTHAARPLPPRRPAPRAIPR